MKTEKGLRVEGLTKKFLDRKGGSAINALNGVSLSVASGSCTAVVGESGSGKTTLGRCLLRLIEPDEGDIFLGEVNIRSLNSAQLRKARYQMQIVFQEPHEALNPRHTVAYVIEEPIRHHTGLSARERAERVRELLALVRLDPGQSSRFPRELSGGQLQRVGIARAIATEPGFLVLDEPTSSLDVSVRAEIMRLLADLQERLEMTYLLISHDLSTVARIADRVAVMYLGSIVEEGPSEEIFANPQHPYTQALISATLIPDPMIERDPFVLEGEIPSPVNLPSGCLFASRCPLVVEECRCQRPASQVAGSKGHRAACIRIEDGTNMIPHSL